MNTINTVYFHQNASSAETSQEVVNANTGSLITLEVDATTIQMKVQGICDTSADNPTWKDLAVINAKQLIAENKIAAPGIYYVAIDGVTKIRTVIESVTGSANVFGIVRG